MLRSFRQAPDWVFVALLVIWGGVAVEVTRRATFEESFQVGWPDECIYMVGARNLAERGTLQTNFYLTHSLLIRGYPHRDVHMPGYVLALAPFVRVLGPEMRAAVALNAVAEIAGMLLLFLLGRQIFESRGPAIVAAALFPLLPPFPGYLAVAYPEIVVTGVFLAGLAWLARGGGLRHAAVAGVLFALGGLFRETLFFALPLYVLALAPRNFWRGFVPAAALTGVLVLAPLSRDRAVHPNALYPSVLTEARAADNPAATVARVLLENLRVNVRMTLEALPFENAEDATLLFLALLLVAPAFTWRWLPLPARRWALGAWASIGLLTAAVFLVYVVRERGGVWGGVRAYMCWAPVLLLLATGGLASIPRAVRGGVAVLAVSLFLALDRWQIYRFYRYKRSDLEDQTRNAVYLERYIGTQRPRRIVSRSFLYGYRHYPVEVVWSIPRDREELVALEKAVDYEFLSFHEKHPLRLHVVQNPRYLRVNKDDRGAEFLVWRRLY